MQGIKPIMRVVARVVCVSVVLWLASCGGSGGGGGGGGSGAKDSDPNQSAARKWNEILLDAIRNDFARPTVHARNLFHISSAMYDAWAIYDATANPFLLGDTVSGFSCELDAFPAPVDVELARQEAISHAAYRLILHRFANSPGARGTKDNAEQQLERLGYNPSDTSVDYSSGSAAAMGNYIARCYIDFGLQDGSNEAGLYENIYYEPVNPPIEPVLPGNPNIIDLNRWQAIKLPVFIDQSGNEIDPNVKFLSPEWGQVASFALTDAVKTTYNRDGFDYHVYYDPGVPPTIDGGLSAFYKRGFEMVSVWSSHMSQNDGTRIDISPASIGSTNNVDPGYYPSSLDEYDLFYDFYNGGDASTGHTVNPVTGAPYTPNLKKRGDYARVLAEFWADGPESETPPGHWFVIFNEVSDHELLEKRFEGVGEELDRLEWDIKSYFVLGGAMHDSAIASWGIKGWYDYLRPVSAIRAMADRGQSSDPAGPHYHADGITLYPGFIELVKAGDPLAIEDAANIDKIKLYAWRGPDFIDDYKIDEAGVGWILAENWWPYQRPTFVTPPFAGYVSGHSTFSRAAAEVMTLLTGDAFFPGGMSGFEASQRNFLVFEDGPSEDIILEWATYRDASDQCSLSRIWGGIHPPADDIPGRLIGMKIGPAAFTHAKNYFEGTN
jgi:hypothetical protein